MHEKRTMIFQPFYLYLAYSLTRHIGECVVLQYLFIHTYNNNNNNALYLLYNMWVYLLL